MKTKLLILTFLLAAAAISVGLAQLKRNRATKEFMRFARRADIDDRELCAAARRAGRGHIDADLGAGLIKQRLPRTGQGRSGGFRTLAAFRQNHRCVFLYGFPKIERDNISDRELEHWRTCAK